MAIMLRYKVDVITLVGKANRFPVCSPRRVQPVFFVGRGVGLKDVNDWIVDNLRIRGDNKRGINLKREAEGKVMIMIVHSLGQR